MEQIILSDEIQKFINSNLNSDISALLLKGIPFKTIDTKLVVEQIEAKKRSEKKLPTWFNTTGIYYPNKLNIEQTSSEITAKYKASLISGESLIDITGGFGIDAFYFSKQISNVKHCEVNPELSKIVKHNYNALNANTIECYAKNGVKVLEELQQTFDWIYIDPSRRDNLTKSKVFLLSDCTPNVAELQSVFFKYSNNIMIKTSPLLDIKATLSELKQVKAIHIVAINNEVKELLWVLEKNYDSSIGIKTVNIKNTKISHFDFILKDEAETLANYSAPLSYLYEPNSAILKSGAFNIITQQLKVNKLHKHSHLYTSNELIAFPGRSFKIEQVIPFNKKQFAKTGIVKANVTTRNFPLSVAEIRKKLKLKDGGSMYLFFTTNQLDEKVIIICSKAN